MEFDSFFPKKETISIESGEIINYIKLLLSEIAPAVVKALPN